MHIQINNPNYVNNVFYLLLGIIEMIALIWDRREENLSSNRYIIPEDLFVKNIP